MKQTVIGVFDNASEATKAITALRAAGFGLDSIDQSSRSGSDDAGMPVGAGAMASRESDYYDTGKSGGVSGFFKSLFGGNDDTETDEMANRYSEVAGRSHTIITVHAESEAHAQKASDIMDESGAVDMDDDEMADKDDMDMDEDDDMDADADADMDTEAAPARTAAMPAMGMKGEAGMTGAIPIIEEQLQVGKRTVETGGARVRSRIVSRPVEEQLRLREERVRVERTATNRPATEADFQAFKEGEIELVEHAEVAVVSKEARVVGEVSLNKEVGEREETISDTVRHTEVDVEELAGKEKMSINGEKPAKKGSSL